MTPSLCQLEPPPGFVIPPPELQVPLSDFLLVVQQMLNTCYFHDCYKKRKVSTVTVLSRAQVTRLSSTPQRFPRQEKQLAQFLSAARTDSWLVISTQSSWTVLICAPNSSMRLMTLNFWLQRLNTDAHLWLWCPLAVPPVLVLHPDTHNPLSTFCCALPVDEGR